MSKRESLTRWLTATERAQRDVAVSRQVSALSRVGQVSRSTILLAEQDVAIDEALNSGIDAENNNEMTDENLDLSDDNTDAISDSQDDSDGMFEEEFEQRTDAGENLIIAFQNLEQLETDLEAARQEIVDARAELDEKLGGLDEDVAAAQQRLTEAEQRLQEAEQSLNEMTDELAEAVANSAEAKERTVQIGRTVDGLNRVFAGRQSPGRGYIGLENLAPSIVGSGQWAEVRRNHLVNPNVTSGSWGFNAAVPPSYGAGFADFTFNENSWASFSRIASPVNAGSTAAFPTGTVLRAGMLVENIGSIPFSVGVGLLRYNATIGATNTVVELQPGAKQWVVSPDYTISSSDDGRFRPIVNPGNTVIPAGAKLRVYDGAVVAPVTGAMPNVVCPIAGSLADRSVDPDMRMRWLGAVNNSVSVMEIETIAGLGGLNAVAGLSEAGGMPAARIISTSETLAGSARFFPTGTVTSGVAEGVIHIPAGRTEPGAFSNQLRIVFPGSIPTIISNIAPNIPGPHKVRAEWSGATPSNINYYNGAHDTDVRWTNMGVYAGAVPADAEPLHNGDLWYVLDADLNVSAIRIWNGQDWVAYKLVADSVVAANSIGAPLIKAGTIQALVAEIQDAFIRNANIQDLDVGKLIASNATLREAVVEKLWAEVVRTKFLTVTEKLIGQDALFTGAVGAEQLATNALDFKVARGMQMIAALIQAGDGFLISETDGLMQWAPDGRLNVWLPADGSPAQFRGDLTARSLTVPGRATFEGEAEVSSGGALTISSGVTTPAVPPSVSAAYEQIRLPNLTVDGKTWGPAFAGGNMWRAVNVHNSDQDYLEKYTLTGQLVATYPVAGNPNGLTAIGNELFIMSAPHTYPTGNPVDEVLVYNTSGVFQRKFAYTHGGSNTYRPGIGNDGTNYVIAQCTKAGILTWRRFNPTTGALISTVTTNDNFRANVAGIYIGAGDFGATRVVVAKPVGGNLRQLVVFSENGQTYYPESSWYTPSQDSDIRGISWQDGKFWSLTRDGIVTAYEPVSSPRIVGDDTNNWWVGYTWAATSPARQTPLSPTVRFVYPRRAKVRISLPDIPKGVQRANVYIDPGTVEPTRTQWTPPIYMTTTTRVNALLPRAGSDQPPLTNSFPSADPGRIKSANAMFDVDGLGVGKWGPYRFDAAGAVTGSGTVIGGEVTTSTVGANGGMQEVTITLPAGRYTTPPVVVASSNNGRVNATPTSVTTTSFALRAWNFTTVAANTVGLTWQAMER